MPSCREYLPPEIKKLQSRPRLYRYFEEKQVLIIEAGPGQGKSAAVYDYIKSENRECLWYKLQKKDCNYRFFIEKIESYISICHEGRYQKLNTKNTDSLTPSEAAMSLCGRVNNKLADNLYLVFDNFEAVKNSMETCKVIEKILEELSKKIHIVLISRETPYLSLSKIRSRKELIELKNKALAYNRDDLHSLTYSLYDMSLDSIVLERLIEVTGGWITGIIFLLERICCINRKEGELLLDNFLLAKALPETDDYFRTEIISTIPRDMHETLIKISAASEFSPHLVEMVTGSNGIQFINDLQRMNLFLILTDPSKYQYAFTPIFRTFLLSEFEKLDSVIKRQTLVDISDYFTEENDSHRAIKYLCDAGEFKKAKLKLISYAEELIKNNEYEAINDLITCFPEVMLEEDPYLSYYKAVVNNLMQPESSRKKLLELLSTFKNAEDYNHEASIYAVLLTNYFFFQTNAETIKTIISMAEDFLQSRGDKIAAEQKELLKALIPLGQWWTGASREKAFEVALRAEETSSRIKNEEAFLCSRLVLSKIYIARGEFNDAKQLLIKTEKLFNDGNFNLYRHYQCLSSFYLGDTYFYCGEISTAVSQIYKALSSSGSDFAFRPYLELNLIYYNLYLNNIEKADALYDRLRDKETGENLYLKYNIAFLFEMLLAYRGGNKHRAEYYCNRLLEKDNESLLLTDFPFSYQALAEVSIVTDGIEKTAEILELLFSKISREEFPYPYASASALYGYIKHLSGETAASEQQFKEMEEIVIKNKYSNLDICSPDLLKSIANISGSSVFENFPRLKHEKQYENISASKYGMEINTLGQLSVMVQGREISADLLGGQKRVMDLLKLLIVYRRNGVMKERIYELFWPRYSYKSARDNLNTIIYRLRKLLNDKGDFLSTDVNSIRFKENTVITDIDRFLEYINLGTEAERNGNHEVSVKMFTSAVALYKGDFLESDLYYDFIRDERENLKSKFRNLLFRMIILSLNSADFREALEWSKRLIEADPLCEPAYRMVMIASSAVGNRSEIPRLFDKLNKKLQAYYKVTADDKTVILKEKLISGTVPDESMWRDETII